MLGWEAAQHPLAETHHSVMLSDFLCVKVQAEAETPQNDLPEWAVNPGETSQIVSPELTAHPS